MPYVQRTHCISAARYTSLNQYVWPFLGGTVGTILAGFVALAQEEPWCLLIAGYLGFLMFLGAYCDFDLNGRLICLDDEDKSVIGLLMSVSRPHDKPFNLDRWDTDFCINLLPCPNQPGATQQDVEANAAYGGLVKETQLTRDRGLPFKGHSVTVGQTETAILHAEFEGSGVYDLLWGVRLSFGAALIAFGVCLAPSVGWVAALIAGLLAVLVLLIAAVVGLLDYGDPADAGSPGELHSYDPANPENADVLYVRGAWIFDTLHDGWNELHPVKHCQIARCPQQTDPIILKKAWDAAVTDVYLPATRANQELPENRWAVHPDIDGCAPAGPTIT